MKQGELGFVHGNSCVEPRINLSNDSNSVKTDSNGLGCVNAQSCVEPEYAKLSNVKFAKNDIRSYGESNRKTEIRSEAEHVDILKTKVETARSAKPKFGVLPSMSERLFAGRVIDKIQKNKSIHIPEPPQTLSNRKLQKDTGLAIVGADVVSLFPSL